MCDYIIAILQEEILVEDHAQHAEQTKAHLSIRVRRESADSVCRLLLRRCLHPMSNPWALCRRLRCQMLGKDELLDTQSTEELTDGGYEREMWS